MAKNWAGWLFGLSLALLVTTGAKADELSADAASTFELSTFMTALELPTALEFLPDGRTVVTEKMGRVVVRLPNGDHVVAGNLNVDSKTEKGLLNVIAHPRFAENHLLIFFYSSAGAPDNDKQKISLIRLGDDNHLELSSEQVLVKGLRGPDDHEMGGGLAIDSTGNLLVGVGDTGCRAKKLPEPPFTPTNYFATCLTNGNGKILRIGLDGSIPKDNPLTAVDSATSCGNACGDDAFKLPKAEPRKDIWTWGLRNPWRIWVDPQTGNVWTADVGDIAHEEIDVIPKEGGHHYGWPFREGPAGHPVAECRRVTPDRGDCVDPAYYCRHDDVPGDADSGCKSINGGLIVDDCRWPDGYRGRYFFGDNANGKLWSLEPNVARDGIVAGSRKDVGKADGFVVDMDLGSDASLYVTVMRIPPEESKVIRITPKVQRACEGGSPGGGKGNGSAAAGSSSAAAAGSGTPSASSSASPSAMSSATGTGHYTQVSSSSSSSSSGDSYGGGSRRSRRKLAFAIIAAFALLVAAGLVLTGRK
ncbi:MAG TPA: PQQ-dependent sugar dehydrogenase [Polyangiaceae bacterium]|nr:PQQ-dependent sugar dehydrogenase [Polyangiaceae bacterium]